MVWHQHGEYNVDSIRSLPAMSCSWRTPTSPTQVVGYFNSPVLLRSSDLEGMFVTAGLNDAQFFSLAEFKELGNSYAPEFGSCPLPAQLLCFPLPRGDHPLVPFLDVFAAG